jgi:hypothetical protein
MAASPRTWKVELRQELREDADRLFIPVADLDGAVVGDAVVLTDDDGHTEHGNVIELIDDPSRGRFAVVSLEDQVG